MVVYIQNVAAVQAAAMTPSEKRGDIIKMPSNRAGESAPLEYRFMSVLIIRSSYLMAGARALMSWSVYDIPSFPIRSMTPNVRMRNVTSMA